MILALLLACRSAPEPPSLSPVAAALRDYEQGRAALDAGRDVEAAAAFERARATRDDPLLMAWEAHARAADGQLAAAERLLREALRQRPGFQLARYNLGCVLARQGRQEEAAREVGVALVGGVVAPRQAARDPDIARHLDHPAWAFLPDEPLGLVLSVPPSVAFWGSEVEVSVAVQGVDDGAVELEGGDVVGPVTLLKVVEDERRDALGDRERVITWTLRVEGPGEVVVGPVVARQGAWVTAPAQGRFPTSAPPGRDAGAVRVVLPVPSRLAARVTAPRAVPTPWGEVVLAPPGCRVAGGVGFTGSWRDGGATLVELGQVGSGPVTVRCGADPVWSWPAP